MNMHLRGVSPHAAEPVADVSALQLVALSPPAATVVDVGCFGWRLAGACSASGRRCIGVDRREPPGRPSGADFATMDRHLIHLPGDMADLVVASHVIEHLLTPVELVVELARITRPGGRVYIEAPSELSALHVSSDDPQDHSFESFWDDPTHVRPYTPGALYRLAISAGLIPEFVGRGVNGSIPVVTMVARVPFEGSIGWRYCSFKEVSAGLVNAMRAVWPERPVTLRDEDRLADAVRRGVLVDGGRSS